MSRAVRLAAKHRRRHRQLLAVDEARIFRPGGDERWWDEHEGRYEPAPDVEVASGRVLAVSPQTSEQVIEVGSTPHTIQDLRVELDIDHHLTDGDQIRVGNRFEFTRTINPHLAGRRLWVTAVSDGTLAPARILTLSEEKPRA